MDKELIFSYRRKTVHTESFDANHPKTFLFHLRVFHIGGGVGSDLVVGKRINRSDAGT